MLNLIKLRIKENEEVQVKKNPSLISKLTLRKLRLRQKIVSFLKKRVLMIDIKKILTTSKIPGYTPSIM